MWPRGVQRKWPHYYRNFGDKIVAKKANKGGGWEMDFVNGNVARLLTQFW